MLNSLSLRAQLIGLLLGIIAVLSIFAFFVWQTLNHLNVGAIHMAQGKDVVADILPPPLYIIEAKLNALEMKTASASELADKVVRVAALKKDYDARNTYWESADLDRQIKQSLLGEQRRAADDFWTVLQGSYLKALQTGNQASIDQEFTRVHEAYLRHRAGVDRTVELASAYATRTLEDVETTAASARRQVVLIATIGILIVGLSMIFFIRLILRRLGEEPQLIQAVASQIASGNLSSTRSSGDYPQGSLMSSMMQMQGSLRAIIAEVRRVSTALASASKILTQNANEVTSSSARQTDASTSMAAAVEEVTVSIAHIATSARSARGEGRCHSETHGRGARSDWQDD
jgi:methyl-accepting chemotaxis protein